jgi:tetratricopeptide (TPR) repeat protein
MLIGRRSRAAAFAAIVLLVGSWPASAQIPTRFINLQVLPQDISQADLIARMREYATALGVRCNHCHVGENAATLEGFDFAADARDTKRVARGMMRMTRELNDRLLPQIGRPVTVKVSCVTCHRGLAVPRTLLDVLTATAERDGVDAALKQYRALREESYGKGTYDFSAGTLNMLAEDRARQRHDVDGAIAVMRANVEVNPNLWTSYSLLAQLYEQKGDKTAARNSIEKALQLDPGNAFLKKRLDDLK